MNRSFIRDKSNAWQVDPTIANACVAWVVLIVLGSLVIAACLIVGVWVLFKFIFVVATKGTKLIYGYYRRFKIWISRNNCWKISSSFITFWTSGTARPRS